MKLYLDDERKAPEGWLQTDLVPVCINLLGLNTIPLETLEGINEAFGNNLEHVTHLSLDHDLGMFATGYDVLLWIEEQIFTGGYFIMPEITIHTANVSARVKMELGLARIHLELEKT